MEIKIGQKYKTRGKHPNICTVTDIYKTYNSKNELIKTSYVAIHEFIGQIITEYDIPKTTILRGLI